MKLYSITDNDGSEFFINLNAVAGITFVPVAEDELEAARGVGITGTSTAMINFVDGNRAMIVDGEEVARLRSYLKTEVL